MSNAEELTSVGRELAQLAAAASTAGVAFRAVSTDADVIELRSAGFELDYRARLPEGTTSPLAGLVFDTAKLSTQSFVAWRHDRPVGIFTLVVEPRSWLAERRYFRRSGEVVEVLDHARALGEVPEFAIEAGWANVAPGNVPFMRAGIRLLRDLLHRAAELAPGTACFMVGAAGPWPFAERAALQHFSRQPVGQRFPLAQLPSEFRRLGEARRQSRATVRFAHALGCARIAGVGDQDTLGPMFVRCASPS